MKHSILVVDDTPANLRLLCSMLDDHGYEVRPVTDGPTALAAARADLPDLVLLDINMPGMNGYAVCSAFKADERLAEVPIIFISALNDPIDKVQAFQVGGLDYITKPFHIEEVLARIETQLALRRQRQEIERLREQDRRYFEKLSAMKDDVMRHASHDLKNPLGRVLTGIYILEQGGEISSEQGQRALGIIQRGAEQMRDLITDLLDLARIETGLAVKRVRVPLAPFLRACVEDFLAEAEERNITLTLVAPPEVVLPADDGRLRQVIHNLLSNALKYTPAGGRVEVAAEIEAEEVIIQVRDDGLGIPAADLPHIFEKFYRSEEDGHRAVEGTGLGLSIVKSIVEQHGGQVWVASEPGVGTTVSVALPHEAVPVAEYYSRSSVNR